MKRIYLKKGIFIILPVLAVVAFFVACKKDKLTDPEYYEHHNHNEDKTSDYVVNRIMKFDNKLKQIKQGLYRDISNISADSALWDIESLFNATFSFPDRNYVEKKIQKLSFNIDIYDGEYLKMEDVSDLYDDIIISVREAYRNDGIESDKSLMSIVINKGEIISDKLYVDLLMVSGRAAKKQYNYKAELWGPFKDDDCWYFGEYGGSCDDPSIVYDAAKALEDVINFNYGNRQEETSAHRNIYVNMTNISLSGNEYWNERLNDYYLYYKVNCPDSLLYLDHNELNKYYHNIRDVIFNVIPNDVKYSSVLPISCEFMEICIDGMFSMEGKNTIHNHNTNVIYGNKHVISKIEMGPAVDLLK